MRKVSEHEADLKKEKLQLEKKLYRRLTPSENCLILFYIEAFPEKTYTQVWEEACQSIGR